MNHDPLSENEQTNGRPGRGGSGSDGPGGPRGPDDHDGRDDHDDAAMRDGNAAADAEARRRARQRRRGRWLRAAVWPLVALAAVIALALGGLFAALQTESGTRYAWDAAVELLGGRLSGTLEGGALATGLRLSHLRWHDATTDIQIDHVEGQWRLQRAPLKFIVDFLHAGKVEVRLAASTTPSTRTRTH